MRTQVDVMRAVMAALEQQLELVEGELRRFARTDRRCQALETIFGVGPILACQLLAEIGDVRRFRRARQLVRASAFCREIVGAQAVASARALRASSAAMKAPDGRARRGPSSP